MGDISLSVDKEMRVEEEEVAPFNLTEVDKWVLSQTDEEFKLHDWDELREIISSNRLDTLKRKPSDLRRYISWTSQIKREYGSSLNFLLQNRLPPSFSSPSPPISAIPFQHQDDFAILINDWPYCLESDVTHIVIWTKTAIPTVSEGGDMTEESKRIIEGFVKKVFRERLGEKRKGERVLWFKNWGPLQSVRALDHVHVLVRGAGEEDLRVWTGRV